MKQGEGVKMKKCSLWSECYGQTPLVYTEMAARSRSGEEDSVCVCGGGGQVEDESRSRPDGG